MWHAFVSFNATVSRWCMYIAVAGLVGIVATVALQVFGRYVLNDTPTWAESTALVLILYVTMLGAALDPLAVLWVFVFANNGDFDAYQPRLARYHRGVDDHIAAAALDGLRELYSMVSDREGRLADLGAKKVTRTLAQRHVQLRPVVALFSECHELFGHPDHGREAADLAVQTMRRARKTAITLAFDTQSSRADAIPPKIVELVKINACFAVKSWRSNDGFLGDGSFQAGIRATELRPGKDVGTSIVTGATPERFEIVKWFYIEADDDTGYDAAADIIIRAVGYLDQRTPIAELDAGPESEPRDLLADLVAVLGKQRVPAADVPARLRHRTRAARASRRATVRHASWWRRGGARRRRCRPRCHDRSSRAASCGAPCATAPCRASSPRAARTRRAASPSRRDIGRALPRGHRGSRANRLAASSRRRRDRPRRTASRSARARR